MIGFRPMPIARTLGTNGRLCSTVKLVLPGLGYSFETMVFEDDSSFSELASERTQTLEQATAAHARLCAEWGIV